MPLDPTFPPYLAEVVPASIDALGRGLCAAYGRPPGAFGAKGNTIHLSGYHRSRRWILTSADSTYGSSDYSVRHELDRSGDQDWISAFDFTPGSWGTPANRALVRELTGRLYAAAKARDPRLSALREFAGTLDGVRVVTFNCSDGSLKSPFDSSHLDHGHGSLWRSRAANDHSGILAVMLGEDMDTVDRMRLKLLYENWAPTRAEYVAAGGSGADYDTLTAGGSARNALALKLGELAIGQVKLGDGLAALSAQVEALAAGGVTHEQLVAALIDPAVLAAVRQAAFEGAQRAESE